MNRTSLSFQKLLWFIVVSSLKVRRNQAQYNELCTSTAVSITYFRWTGSILMSLLHWSLMWFFSEDYAYTTLSAYTTDKASLES